VLDEHDVARELEPPPPTGARPRKKSRRMALLAALALLGIVGLAGIVMGRAGGVEDVNEVERRALDRIGALAVPSVAAPQPPAEEQVEKEPASEPAGAAAVPAFEAMTPDGPGSAPEVRTKPERALLRVLADPWGNVWIDDEKVGRAPVRRSVRPGTHKVQIGDEYPEEPKYVKVAPGESRMITLRKAGVE
jgi:serine/threonine-protein kinase